MIGLRTEYRKEKRDTNIEKSIWWDEDSRQKF
jgi:hypothetical protein